MKKNKYKYNAGGKVGFQDVAGLASAFVNPISAIPSALNLIGKLAYNPASYTPAKMNESPMGYNDGGDPEDPRVKSEKKVRGYYGRLYSSKFYKNIIDRQGSPDWISNRLLRNRLGDRTIKVPVELTDKGGSAYYPKENKVRFGIEYKQGHNPDSILSHEMAHAFTGNVSDNISYGSYSNKNNIDKQTTLKDKIHTASPEELRADLNSVRFMLYDAGIWNIDRPITQKDINKLKKNKVYSNDTLFKRTLDKVDETNKLKLNDSAPNQKMVELLNSVTYNDYKDDTIEASYGADLQNQLQITGGNDQELGNHAVQVEGNPGVDTNYRNIGGQNVALTQGEIVRQDQDGSAYVWSNNPKMKHPSGTTFAKAMKPIENKIARLKSRVEKDHTDVYASNALGHLEQMIEQNKNIEETMRQKKGSPTAQRFNKGGYIKANDGIKIKKNTDPTSGLYGSSYTEGNLISNDVMDIITQSALEKRLSNPIREGFENYSMVQNRVPLAVSPTITRDNSPFRNPKGFIQANPSPLTSVTGTGLPKTESLSTFEDKAFLGAKSLETAFRVGAALDKPMQYDTRRYNVDRIRYSPQRALDANQANYQGAQFDINTGNANTDRILRNNLYGQKMAADRDVIGRNDQMQNQSDLQVNQYNAQAKANVDNINEQIRGRDYQATDAALTSIGNLSSIFQQAGGAKAHNRITMSTLNSLSRRYGIDVPELMALMQGQGDVNKGTVKYKGNGNG